jgi:alpha-1,3-rhamnosyl/mannosyltransferase
MTTNSGDDAVGDLSGDRPSGAPGDGTAADRGSAGPSPANVGVNLLWLVPGVVGGTEQAMVETLLAVLEDPPEDISFTLYALESLGDVHPRLVEGFNTRLLPISGGVKPFRIMAEGTWLSRAVRRDGIDLMHYAGGTVPVGSRLPAVVTLHDLQPFDMPENFHPVKRAYIHRMVPKALRDADKVIVPCEFVRDGIIERFQIDPSRLVIVPWGVAPLNVAPATVDAVRARYGLPERWFTYPAITYPHKNHVTLVRAFAGVVADDPDVALVLTGRRAGAETELREEVQRLGLTERVWRTGAVSREDLLALLAGAVAMPFPSRYEGFGLPVLEAMATSTAVISSDATALPEAVGDAGMLVDSDDVDSWSEAMVEMLRPDVRERFVEAGRARAREFSWARTASETVEVHRTALRDVGLKR